MANKAVLVDPVEWARSYRDAAIADGWDAKPMCQHEAFERAAMLKRDGWVMHVLARPPEGKFRGDIDITVWGPDGLAVPVIFPRTYSMADLIRGLRYCLECGAEDVKTYRVAFANRCCAACRPALKAKLERPGWCD